MTNSILDDVKLQLGIDETDDSFDPQVIDAINTVFDILNQIGVGPADGFYIEDNTTAWDSYLAEHGKTLRMVRTYMYAKVRLIFDPPLSSAVMDALNKIADETEFRLKFQAEYDRFKSITGDTGEQNYYK